MCKGQRSTLGVFYRSPCSLPYFIRQNPWLNLQPVGSAHRQADQWTVSTHLSLLSAWALGTRAWATLPVSVSIPGTWTLGFKVAQQSLSPLNPLSPQPPFDFYFTKAALHLSGVCVGGSELLSMQKLRDTDKKPNQENSYMRSHRNFRFSSFVEAPTSPQRMEVRLEGKFCLLPWQTRGTDVSLLMLMFTHCYLGLI